MKKIFKILWALIFLNVSTVKSQCVPPATFSVGPYILLCGGTTIISAGTNSTVGTYSYSWNSPPFAAMSCPGGPSCYNNQVNTAGVYTVTIFDTTVPGCFSTNTMSVIQSTNIGVFLSGIDTICNGSSDFISAFVFPSGPISYTWSTGSNLSSISVTPSVTTVYSVVAVNMSNSCSGTGSFTVNVNLCLGVDQLLSEKNISIAPNPNNGKFHVLINANLENGEIRIVNAIGQEIYRQNIKQGKNEINTGVLAKGIYHYSIYQNKEPVNRGKILIE
jgi:hypothetical protein